MNAVLKTSSGTWITSRDRGRPIHMVIARALRYSAEHPSENVHLFLIDRALPVWHSSYRAGSRIDASEKARAAAACTKA